MSATNWTTCPQCPKEVEKELELLKVKIEHHWKRGTQNQYLDYVERQKKLLAKPVEVTLQEDYECYIHEDHFIMYYMARCDKCGFKFDFNKKVALEYKQ